MSMAVNVRIFVTICPDYCSSLQSGSLSLSFTLPLSFIKNNLIMKLPCFKDLLPVPHGQKSHTLSKTHEALDSLNPSFLFCFYQSTHITYPLVTLELFTIPWPSQILSRLFCLLCLCTDCSFCLECLSCLLCQQNAPLPLRSRSFHSSQLKPFFWPSFPSSFHNIYTFLAPKSHYLFFHYSYFLIVLQSPCSHGSPVLSSTRARDMFHSPLRSWCLAKEQVQ